MLLVIMTSFAINAPEMHRSWCLRTNWVCSFEETAVRTKHKPHRSEELMGFDKWTVALAALRVVSVASVAKVGEGPSSVITALASTTLRQLARFKQ